MNEDLELRKRVEELGAVVAEDRRRLAIEQSVAQDAKRREELARADARKSAEENAAWLQRTLPNVQFHRACECGCGFATRIHRGYGRMRGRPMRFLPGHNMRRHRMSETPEYHAYHIAKQRCQNPKDKDFVGYGGRGIRFEFVSFEQFLRALGPRPGPAFSLDRKDVNGPYAPWNCRWADALTQAHNRRPPGSNQFLDEMPF